MRHSQIVPGIIYGLALGVGVVLLCTTTANSQNSPSASPVAASTFVLPASNSSTTVCQAGRNWQGLLDIHNNCYTAPESGKVLMNSLGELQVCSSQGGTYDTCGKSVYTLTSPTRVFVGGTTYASGEVVSWTATTSGFVTSAGK